MIDRNELIKKIDKVSKIYFVESTFYLHPSTANRFEAKGNNSSKAINNYKNFGKEVSVIKWFDDYWIYLEIRFEDKNTFISLSVFQGELHDNEKIQLFRAEWDDYNNPNEKHPQPHWHITSNQAIEKTFQELVKNEDEEKGFAALILNEEKSKIIDLNKIHFTMIGNWINDETHVHPIDDVDKIAKWFQGLYSNLRVQLEYVK